LKEEIIIFYIVLIFEQVLAASILAADIQKLKYQNNLVKLKVYCIKFSKIAGTM
jgi:hypothetical protein